LFVWGSPCQDLSLAGKRKGFDGAKSSLFREGARIQSEMMPKVFIFENVKGLLSSNGGNDYKEVIKTFQDMGYLIASKVVNTKEHGIPQNRERVFIVGFLDADQYHNFTFEDAQPLKLRLRDMLEESVDNKYYLSDKVIQGNLIHKERHENRGNGFAFEPKTEDDISGCLSTKYGNRQTDTYLKVKSATSCGYETATENDSINFTHPDSKTRRGRVGKGVAQTLDCACNQGVIEPKMELIGMLDIKGNDSIRRVYCDNGIAPCLTTMGGGNREPKVETNYRIRKLTPKECFRLQGVKDEDIILSVSDSQAYKIAGNAISVNVMQMILKQLYKPKPSGGLF
jgi:DNA (cytosine-5)-methyltransferase 1